MKYEVQILESVPFEVKTGEYNGYEILPRKSSVMVNTIDDEGNATVRRYGLVDRQEIYNLIEAEQRINLNNCYIAGFSLKEYKKKMNIDQDSYVSINLFNATNAFFDTGESFERAMGKELYFKKDVPGYKDIDFYRAQFGNGSVDFSGTQFGDGNVHFYRAHFGDGSVDFSNAQFGDGNVNFIGAHFGNGSVDFFSTQFGNGSVDFSNAQFGDGDVVFLRARFGNGSVDFSNAQFGDGNVNFVHVQFGNGKIDFNWAQFGDGDVAFALTQFGDGSIDFSDAQFGDGVVSFFKAQFGDGVVNFSSIDLDGRKENRSIGAKVKLNNCYLRDHVNMKDAKFSELSIENCTIEKTLNLEGLKVEKLSLKDTNNLGQIFIKWKENNICKILEADSARDRANQLVMLKENFHTIGRYDDEDLAYVEYKRTEWKAKYCELRKEGWYRQIYKIPYHGLNKIVCDWMGKYATSPQRVALSMLAFIAIFTVIYCVFPNLLEKNKQPLTIYAVKECISYSIAVFLSLNFDNICPLTFVAIVVSEFESFIGFFMMSYFIVAFARKVLR